jgi:hypothetical protein
MADHVGVVETPLGVDSVQPVGVFNDFAVPPQGSDILLFDPMELIGVLVRSTPSPPAENHAGHDAGGFGEVWFNTVHILPSGILDLGGVADGQVDTFYIWNAYDVENNLDAIFPTNLDGVALTQVDGGVDPVFGPLEIREYAIEILPSSDLTIDGDYLFSFALTYVSLNISAIRSVMWDFNPDWSNGIKERYVWKTQILESADGSEQRISMKSHPDRYLDFPVVATNEQLRSLNGALFSWQDKFYTLPYWVDSYVFTELIPQSSSQLTLQLDTAVSRLHGEDSLAMVYRGYHDYDILSVDSVDYIAQTITLRSLVGRDIIKGSVLIPLVTARISDETTLSRIHANLTRAPSLFRVETPPQHFVPAFYWASPLTDFVPSSYYPIETGRPGLAVMNVEPNRVQIHKDTYRRKMISQETDTGDPWMRDKSQRPRIDSTMSWMLHTRETITEFLTFVFMRFGRMNACWMPTFSPDLIQAELLPAGSTDLHVEPGDYTKHYGDQVSKSHLMLELKTGQKYYRRVTGTYVHLDGHEVLQMAEPIDIHVYPENIYRISLMSLMRLAEDHIDLHWHSSTVLEAKAVFRTVNED